jgi:tetratricopeptide (TPR) repeat protein
MCCALVLPGAVAQNKARSSNYEQVTAALQQAKVTEAEAALREMLRGRPDDARALGLMGVVLDAQDRYAEAEYYYLRAFRITPNSASLLNNLGNHYLAQQNAGRARDAFLKVVAIEPDHPNANLQLAQLSVAAKDGGSAIRHLQRLPPQEQQAPAVQFLRAQALDLSGERSVARQLLLELEKQGDDNARLSTMIGMMYVDWKEYDDAERVFTLALATEPTNLEILHNLGLAALRAGHFARAKDVFEAVLQKRPDDPDALQDLGRVYAEMGQKDQAVVLLVRASKLAPKRDDILMFLAHMLEELGFYGDTALAYDRYLKLRPSDAMARRERGFAYARSGKMDEALADLQWYVGMYPHDPGGLYELAIAETVRDTDKALDHLNQAIALDADLHSARHARAVLHYQAGQPNLALKDVEVILEKEPDNAGALDLLGQSLLALEQPERAAEPLARAAQLSPKDPKILTHYGRALLRTGRKDEANKVFAAFRQLGPDPGRRKPYEGLLRYLSLPEAEQRAQYEANLRRMISLNSRDPDLQLRLGVFLLSEDKHAEAIAALGAVADLTRDAEVLAQCGRALLDHGEPEAARKFLEAAVAPKSPVADTQLDYSIAVFHTAGPEAALGELDKIPPSQRQADYYLLRAQILDAQGKFHEAVDSLHRGLATVPTRAFLYHQAAEFLIKHQRYLEAIDFLSQADRVLPSSPVLMLIKAIALELAGRKEEALRLLADIHFRWPEWPEPYVAHGIILASHAEFAEAKPLLETALALGATNDARVYYYLAWALTRVAPEDTINAQQAIEEALRLAPQNAAFLCLAGKIANARRDYETAQNRLTAALQLEPDMVEAHEALSSTYRALGEHGKADAERERIVHIKRRVASTDQGENAPLKHLLFLEAISKPSVR